MRGMLFQKSLIVELTIILHAMLRSSGLDNIALNKPTIQSSTFIGPQQAVDGDPDPDYTKGKCSHTDSINDVNPWWLVDLLDIYILEYVLIYNRNMAQDRLDNLSVDGFLHYPLLTSHEPQRCGYNPGPSGDVVNLTCSEGIRARFVLLSGPQTLTLCEVEVYGQKADPKGCANIRLVKLMGLQMSSAVPTVDLGHTESPSDCSTLCLQRVDCKLFNYNVVNGECKVPVGLVSNSTIESSSDWNLYSI